MMQKINKTLIYIAIATISLSSCSWMKYNDSNVNRIEDLHKNDVRVYGEDGQPARHMKNVYTADPSLEKRTNTIREILYGKVDTMLISASTPQGTAQAQFQPDTTGTKKK